MPHCQNRTDYYSALRKSFHLAPAKRQLEADVFLIDHQQQHPASDEYNTMICAKDGIETELRIFEQKLTDLEHKLDEYKFGLPTLTIPAERLAYQQTKSSIESGLARLNGLLQQLKLLPAAATVTSFQQLQENLAVHFGLRLRSLNDRFKQVQKVFRIILEDRQIPSSVPVKTGDKQQVSLTPEPQQLTGNQVQQQLVLDESSRFMLDERNRAIDQIVSDVSNMHDLYNQIQIVVNDQGSLLDRIDFNLDKTRTNLSKAIGQLKKTVADYSLHQKRLILLFLSLMVFVLVVAVTYKK